MNFYVALLVLASLCCTQAANLRLFERVSNEKLFFKGQVSEECSNLRHGQKKASSVDTKGACVLLFAEKSCKGRETRVKPGFKIEGVALVSSLRACGKGASGTTGNKGSQGGNGGGGSSGGSGKDYQKAGLELHNKYRARHHAQPLQMSDELNRRAEMCAKYYSDLGRIDHSCPHKNGAGENLAWFGSSTGSDSEFARKSTDNWYNEVKDYNYANPERSRGVVGHFTAMVWKSAERFGMGFYQNHANIQTYGVGLYDPHPNVQGRTRENVQSP